APARRARSSSAPGAARLRQAARRARQTTARARRVAGARTAAQPRTRPAAPRGGPRPPGANADDAPTIPSVPSTGSPSSPGPARVRGPPRLVFARAPLIDSGVDPLPVRAHRAGRQTGLGSAPTRAPAPPAELSTRRARRRLNRALQSEDSTA